jgi:hypothetical protein
MAATPKALSKVSDYYSTATERVTPQYVTPDRAQKLDDERAAQGWRIEIPTVDEIRVRHQTQKAYWSGRNILIDMFIRMHNLVPPFKQDKEGKEEAGYVTPTGDVIFAVDPAPFDIITQAVSMAEAFHPYVTATPYGKVKSDQCYDFQRFCQGYLDMQMYTSNFTAEAIQYIMATGWLVQYFPYDPALKAQDEFPYFIKLLNPLEVYPKLDYRKQPLWVTMERYMTGAELIQEYGDLPGVAELIAGEPDTSLMPDGSANKKEREMRQGGRLDNSKFRTIRFYDQTVTCLLIDGTGVMEAATQQNPALKKLKDNSTKGKYLSALVGSGHSANPYAGVLEHNLGCIPLSFAWCWPELQTLPTLTGASGSSSSTNGPYTEVQNAYGGLPFMFGGREGWKSMNRILSEMHTMLFRNARPKELQKTRRPKGIDTSGRRILLNPDEAEEISYLTPPSMPQEMVPLIQELGKQMARGTFSGATYGERAGQSDRQQGRIEDAGSARLNHVTGEVERGLGFSIRGITRIMRGRGGENLQVAGRGEGEGYGGERYTMTYNINLLPGEPIITVDLKRKMVFLDPEAIAMARSAADTISTETSFKYILKLPDPKGEIIKMRDEKAMSEATAVQPYIEVEALKAQLETAKEKEQLKRKLLKLTGELREETEKLQIVESLKHLPEDVLKAKADALVQEQMEKASQPPDQPPPPPQQPTPGGPGPGPGLGPGPQGPPMPMPMPMMGPPQGQGQGQGLPPGPPQSPAMLSPIPPPGTLMRPPSGLPMQLRPIGPPLPLPPMPRPIGPIGPGRGLPPPASRNNPMGRTATAPHQAMQPFQSPARQQPPGGIGRPGVGPRLMGPQPGRGGALPPRLVEANRAVAPIGPLPEPPLSEATARNKKTRRGKPGGRNKN